MALDFSKTKGKAESSKVETYAYKDGESSFRLVGGILARYVYWLKGKNNKDIPVECLAFDREQEKFTNEEVDHVPHYYKDAKAQWSYTANCVVDGKVIAIPLKKKLFESILEAAESLGDPTDPDTGWDVVFKRKKTGPLAFNVEYSLQTLKCKPRPLTDEERELVANAKTIDEKYPRPTADKVKDLLDRLSSQGSDDETSDDDSNSNPAADKEAVRDL